MRYKVTISYNGSNYHGWAKQNELATVQKTVEDALNSFFPYPITIYGSGRTDAKVHARAQVFHFDTKKESNIRSNELLKALNNILPYDIHILQIQEANSNFNARFDVKQKTYEYIINVGKYDVFLNQLEYQYNKNIDIKKMKTAIKLFIGSHDFLSFCTEQRESNIRKIFAFKISKNNNLVYFTITANGFLRNMVRMIIGALLAFNDNKIDLITIKNNLSNPQKGHSTYKAPGCGLYLKKVKY